MLPGSEIWKPSKGALLLRKVVGVLSFVLLVGTLPLFYHATSFHSFTVVTAMVASVLSIFAGVLSMLGAMSYSRPTLVGGLTLLLTSSALTLYLQECAGRDAVVHCSLADLEARINEVEEVEKMRNHGDVVLAVFSRLDELQQELDLSKSGKLKSATDTALIMAKLEELASMAREVLEEGGRQQDLQGAQLETADIVENRIEAAKTVIAKLEVAKKRTSATGKYELGAEELNKILSALTEAYVGNVNPGPQRGAPVHTKTSLERSKKVLKLLA